MVFTKWKLCAVTYRIIGPRDFLIDLIVKSCTCGGSFILDATKMDRLNLELILFEQIRRIVIIARIKKVEY
jgi:hypothetical protein